MVSFASKATPANSPITYTYSFSYALIDFHLRRDLNPTNILLSDDGSVKLTYFFQYPNVERAINMYAKERLYVAPEVLNLHSDITFASDWWSFGAILFELVTLQVLVIVVGKKRVNQRTNTAVIFFYFTCVRSSTYRHIRLCTILILEVYIVIQQ